MSRQIMKYSPKIRIECYDGKEFYLDASEFDELSQAMNSKKFLEMDGCMIAVSNIKSVVPAGKNLDLVEQMVENLVYEDKEEVRRIVKNRKAENMPVTEWVIRNIIEVITKHEN